MTIRSASERTRSPRFPGYSLGHAIEYARRVYGGVHRATVPSETVFKLMGFAGKSGPSASALGSLRQYGLIEGLGDRTKISELALTIVQPASEEERQQGLRQAARNPEVFRLIHERFGGRFPPSDEPITAYLIRELGFSKRGADECVISLRKTLRTLEELTGDANVWEDAVADRSSEQSDEPVVPSVPERISVQTVEPSSREVMRVRLTRECVAELRFEGPLDERAVINLVRHIELMKEVWAEE
jgi:hypothetical protein